MLQNAEDQESSYFYISVNTVAKTICFYNGGIPFNKKGFDAELSGTRVRMSSAIRIIEEGRAKEALEKIRDSKMIGSKHPEAHDLAEEILATL